MAFSIIGGLTQSNWASDQISVSDPFDAQREKLRTSFGVSVYEDNLESIQDADIIVMAVKPQMFQVAAASICNALDPSKHLIISIAAGILITDMQKWFGKEMPIVRVMPNTPSLINQGVSGLFANSLVTAAQKDLAASIMSAVGKTAWVDDEPLIDSVTGISGSGPAYFFKVMEDMIDRAQFHGLDADQARTFVLQTALGAAMLAIDSDHPPAELRKQVTSPNGTTQAALEKMDELQMTQAIHGGIDAAVSRSQTLSKELGES